MWGEENQNKIQYAYDLGGLDFVLLLEAENGAWTHTRRHDPTLNAIGVDWGLCGTNDHFHPEIVHNPKFLTDWKWQMEQCYRLWKQGTTFYGWKRRHLFRDNFEVSHE